MERSSAFEALLGFRVQVSACIILVRGRTMFLSLKASPVVLLIGIAATLTVCLCFILRPQWVGSLENRLLDAVLTQGTPPSPTGQTVIVALDEATLAEFGPWPWPRDRTARLFDQIRQAEPTVVGLDVVFPGSDPSVPSRSGLPTENDRILAEVLGSGPFILGTHFSFKDQGREEAPCHLHPVQAFFKFQGVKSEDLGLWNAAWVECNLESLTERATGSGFFNLGGDRDGVLRSAPLLMRYGGKELYPSLSLATYLYAKGLQEIGVVVAANHVEHIRLGTAIVPVGSHVRMLVNWRGQAGTMPRVSARDVLHGRMLNALQHKVVFVGVTDAGEAPYTTPYGSGVPAVEVHATLADNLLAQDSMVQPDWALGVEFCLTFVTGILVASLFAVSPTVVALVLTALLGVLLYRGTGLALHSLGMYYSVLFPLAALLANAILLSLLVLARSSKRNP